MIYTYIPYAPKEKEKNLGHAYNTFMNIVKDKDWVCFLDHDALFTTRYWYYQLCDIIIKHKDFGLFTTVTNRIGNKPQRVSNIDINNHDIKYHREIGKRIQEEKYDNIIVLNNKKELLSGVVILISKKTWKKIGGFKDGFLGVDNDIHKKCIDNNIKVGLMEGVYVYHWYRGDNDISHIKKNNDISINHDININNEKLDSCMIKKTHVSCICDEEDKESDYIKLKTDSVTIINKQIENYKKENESNDLIKKIYIYTCITNNYDNLLDFKKDPNIEDYICFTDNVNLKSDYWNVKLISNELIIKINNKIKLARYHKINPHLFLPENSISLWIDGNMKPTEKISEFVYNNNCKFSIPYHPFRNCIYDEGLKIIEYGKDDSSIINQQILKYKNEQYPSQNGLCQSGVIIRNHSDIDCVNIANLWWGEVEKYSKRDQMSFNYVCWNNSFVPNYINPQIIDSEYIEYWSHSNSGSKKIKVDYKNRKNFLNYIKNDNIKNENIFKNPITTCFKNVLNKINDVFKDNDKIDIMSNDCENDNLKINNDDVVFIHTKNIDFVCDSIIDNNSTNETKPNSPIVITNAVKKQQLKEDFYDYVKNIIKDSKKIYNIGSYGTEDVKHFSNIENCILYDFDPNPKSKRNRIEKNNIIYINFAITNKIGYAKYFLTKSGNSLIDVCDNFINVQCIPLDIYTRKLNTNDLDVLNICFDDGLINVLKSSQKTLEITKYVFIKSNSELNNDILELLKSFKLIKKIDDRYVFQKK